MTTTRYAIELEPGKWWNTHAPGWDITGTEYKDIDKAVLLPPATKGYWLSVCKKQFPHARIVKVKCEVQE